MYRREEFRRWFAARGYKANTVATHVSVLNGIDNAFGLDQKLEELGTDRFIQWARNEASGPFEKNAAMSRSALNRYIEFTVAAQSPDDVSEEIDEDASSAVPTLFHLEKEMQLAVRKQLNNLEAGLVADDGGNETIVDTGKIDIVARDRNRGLVAIELKAGLCPAGAIEQILGYAEALAVERKEPVRAFLIAGEFSDRTRAAARRVTGLELRTYEFEIRFNALAASGMV